MASRSAAAAAWTVRALLALGIGLGAAALAGAQAFTDRAAFAAALPGAAGAVDFEAVAAGTTVANGEGTGGVVFSYDATSVLLKVTAAYPAVSGAKALGSTDADILQDGDDIAFGFAARNAFGLAIITAETLADGDLTLAAGGQSASIQASAIQQVLADGSNVYFLGVIDPGTAFTTATLSTVGGGYFFYNLDDIVTSTAPDADADGSADSADNCAAVANGPLAPDAGGHSQLDTDGDGYGNRCDGDFDDNGFVNFADLAVFRSAFGTADAEADLNGSGFVNFADLAIFRSLFGKAPGPSGLH